MDTKQEKLKHAELVEKLQLVKLVNARKTELEILNFGAAVFSLKVRRINVVVGPADPANYLTEAYHTHGKHFGASVGRHAGRISGGSFQIKDQKYPIFEKNGVHLHGGEMGFTYRFWKIKEVSEAKDPFVILEYFSEDGEEGYPGNLRVQVKYTLTEEDTVEITYTAETDKETLVNLTNHAYFNLNGSGSINKHELQINAAEVLEADDNIVPTGNFLKVENTEKDFFQLKEIGEVELDTVFKLEEGPKKAFLRGEQSGISLEVETNQPGLVVYIPPVLPQDWKYTTPAEAKRPAICLETQKFPDAPNNPEFPSVILSPGEQYVNHTSWRFISG